MRLVWDKRSSSFWATVSDEEKRFMSSTPDEATLPVPLEANATFLHLAVLIFLPSNRFKTGMFETSGLKTSHAWF